MSERGLTDNPAGSFAENRMCFFEKVQMGNRPFVDENK